MTFFLYLIDIIFISRFNIFLKNKEIYINEKYKIG